MGVRLLMCLLLWMLSPLCMTSQITCEGYTSVHDTMTLPFNGKVIEGDYLSCTLKKFSEVTFFKATDGRIYLKLLMKENFYFDRVEVLEIKSGSKSYYAKDTRQFMVNKNTALFVVEIYSNYLATLKDFGITGLHFYNGETKFTKSDAKQIKALATCMYDAINKK